MRLLFGFVVIAGIVLATVGCGGYGPKPYYEGPKVSAFSGQVVQNGKPVTFSGDNEAVITFRTEQGKRFGVPIKADGTFSIGWMPTGKMGAVLERARKDAKGGPMSMYTIPGGLTIEDGKTSGYVIDLGKGWKP